MEKKVVIIGAGGFAREILDIFDACNRGRPSYDVLGYIVEAKYGIAGTLVNEKPILGGFDWLEKHANDLFVICGVGTPHHRKRLIERAREAGGRFCSAIHPSAILTRWVTVGEGVAITAGCILTNQISIGNHVQINLGCTIGHNASVADFVTLAPGVHISGNVTLAEGAYIGTGTNIVERICVGEWSIIGAGSTIIRDIPANTTAVGIPAKVIKTREVGWHLLYEE